MICFWSIDRPDFDLRPDIKKSKIVKSVLGKIASQILCAWIVNIMQWMVLICMQSGELRGGFIRGGLLLEGGGLIDALRDIEYYHIYSFSPMSFIYLSSFFSVSSL